MKTHFILPIFFLFLFQTYATDWTKVNIPIPDAEDFAFLKINDNTCYAFILAGTYPNYIPKVLKTTNGGTTWDSIAQQGLVLGSDVKEAIKTDQNIYVLGVSGLYKSSDNAQTWTLVSQTEISGDYVPTDVYADGNTVYVGSPGGLFKSSDEFTSIENINYNLNICGYNYQAVCVTKLNGVLFTTTNSKVFYLVDTTWTQCSGLPDRLSNYNIMAYVNGHYYLSDRANNDYTLYHSLNGIAWTEMESNAAFSDYTIYNNSLFATKITDSDYKRYCVFGNNDSLIDISSDLPAFSIKNGVEIIGNNIYLGLKGVSANESGLYSRVIPPLSNITQITKSVIIIYPNPVSDYLCIQKEKTSVATYSIVDVCGKCIAIGTITEISSRIDVNSLHKGMYFLKIENCSYPFIKE